MSKKTMKSGKLKLNDFNECADAGSGNYESAQHKLKIRNIDKVEDQIRVSVK